WLPRIMIAVALILGSLWALEISPQRMSLADLAAGKLGQYQIWVFWSGDLAEEPGSTASLHVYRLTDPDAPNAYLVVRSPVVEPLGRTTLSGHIEGGREPGQPECAWTAR